MKMSKDKKKAPQPEAAKEEKEDSATDSAADSAADSASQAGPAEQADPTRQDKNPEQQDKDPKRQEAAQKQEAEDGGAAQKNQPGGESAARESGAKAQAAETPGPESSKTETAEPEPPAEERLQKELDKVKAQVDEYVDRWKRSMAEFDNFRKRTQKEKEQSYDRGVREAAERLLPVLDNFERALKGGVPENDAFASGVEMIYSQLQSVLTDLGVEEIEALNQPFDPTLHYAVSHVEDENYGEGIVAEVFQKGYRHKDAVIRCSMVKVAN